MEDRKELIKALKLIKETCKSVSSKECDNMRELGDCTQKEVPEDWIISEK